MGGITHCISKPVCIKSVRQRSYRTSLLFPCFQFMQLLNKMAGCAGIIGVVQPVVIKTGDGIFVAACSDNKAVKAGVLFLFLLDSRNKII